MSAERSARAQEKSVLKYYLNILAYYSLWGRRGVRLHALSVAASIQYFLGCAAAAMPAAAGAHDHLVYFFICEKLTKNKKRGFGTKEG